MLDHVAALVLIFWGIFIFFFCSSYTFYIQNNNLQEFLFSHILTNTYYHFFLIIAILTSVRWYLFVVLICIFILIGDIEHLFITPVCHSCVFFGEMSIQVFAHSLIILSGFLQLSYTSLSILDLNILSDISSVPLLGIYSKELKTRSRRDTCTSIFVAALFTISKIWK